MTHFTSLLGTEARVRVFDRIRTVGAPIDPGVLSLIKKHLAANMLLMFTITTLCLRNAAAEQSSYSATQSKESLQTMTPLLIAPFVEGVFFCDEAVANPDIKSDEEAALFCATINKNGAARLAAFLDAIGPKVSPSGKYTMGYTLTLPLMRYFRRSNGEWMIDKNAIRVNLSTVADTHRPSVIYLSANHFTDNNVELATDLAKDSRNLMWTRNGPMYPDRYFGIPVIAWTLADLNAPITQMRRQIMKAVVDEICALSEKARNRIVAVSLLGEVHQMFPDLLSGPSFSIPSGAETDYSPTAQQNFRMWLTQRYGTVATMNAEMGSSFSSFTIVNAPSKDVRRERLNSIFEHIDAYAAGTVPVYGWLHDSAGRDLRASIYLDGKRLGEAQMGLSRNDVTDAIASIKDPNVGFRYDIDFLNLAFGIHALEVLVTANGGSPLRLTKRDLVIVDGRQSESVRIPHTDTNALPMSSDPNLSGSLDGPTPLQSAIYNPLARAWLEYRNVMVRNYLEHFAQMVEKLCIPKSRIFSHQITPALVGSWNSDLVAVDAAKQVNPYYEQGTTLYGGAAFGNTFFSMQDRLGWTRYAVSEMHPIIPLSPDQYAAMFDRHRSSGAVFVAPYLMSMMPSRVAAANDLGRFTIKPDNSRYGSDRYWNSIISIMRQ